LDKKEMRHWEITPIELKARLDSGETLQVVDVREPEEIAIASLGGKSIPLSELVMRYQELNPEIDTILVCHHGIRSAQATMLLAQLGFKNVANLSGGIDRWSIEVDASVKRY
jgi:rhodanese-related sulfurtransferase